MKKVGILDYGVGNLFSVSRAFGKYTSRIKLISDSKDVSSVDYLVLPGVGAFENGMRELRKRKFDEAIFDFLKTGRPMMGICLGMQMLMDSSEEFGKNRGLGLIPGEVKRICSRDMIGNSLKVPHVGWAGLKFSSKGKGIFTNLQEGDEAYFVHSFMACPKYEDNTLARVEYGDSVICAAIINENLLGFQFHPEKSGDVGLEIVGNFLKYF